MKKIIRICLFIGILGCWSTLSAQSLDELLAVAAENNLELKALYQEYLSALEKAPQVSELPDPEVGAGLFVLPPETRVGPQWVRVGATQMFPWKGTLKTREDVVLAMAKAKYERIEAAKLDLFFQIKRAYFQLYDLAESQIIIQQNVRIFQSMERFALSKVASGKGSSADVLRIQLKIQELEKELSLLENQKDKPLAVINQVLNRRPNTPVSISDTLSLAAIPFNRDTLADNIQANHPMIRFYSTQQEASRKALELNELEGKPSFGVGLDYIMVGRRNDVEISGNGKDIVMPRASIKIPLYRKKYSAKEREEELKIAALENQKKDIQSKFISAIDQAYADQRDATIRIEMYDTLKETTQAAIDILETDYSTAGRNFDELLRLQIDLVNYDLKILKAIVQSHIAKAAIERFIIR
jgi:outer membrane protein TolC